MTIKVTNTGRALRGLPAGKGGRETLELAHGQTAEYKPEDWAAISDRPSIVADIEAGILVVDGDSDEGRGNKKSAGKSAAEKAAGEKAAAEKAAAEKAAAEKGNA